MTISYTWEIIKLEVKDEGSYQDSVVRVFWKKIGTDQNTETGVLTTGTFTSASDLTSAYVAPEDFIPFEQLTSEIVAGWVEQNTSHLESIINSDIILQIDRQLQAVVEKPLPWINQ